MIKTAVIGAGQIAQQHLACLSGLPEARIVGVCDLSRSLAEAAAERYGVKAWFTDHARMLAEAQPDIVHITTPAITHFQLAQDCLNADAHVFLEKPATAHFEEFTLLQTLAEAKHKLLFEDYNYLFNEPVSRLLEWTKAGALGTVVHVEALFCLNLLENDHPFGDPNVRHPVLDLNGGIITDFLPHLASLIYYFCGPVRSVRTLWEKQTQASPFPFDEFRALLQADRASASLFFSANSQPDLFRLTVFGSRAQATANIYENRLTRASMRPVPKPLIPFYNALEEAKLIRHSAWKLLWRKLSSGPGAHEGMWTLIRRVYESIARETPPPISPEDVFEVNRLVNELKKEENKI